MTFTSLMNKPIHYLNTYKRSPMPHTLQGIKLSKRIGKGKKQLGAAVSLRFLASTEISNRNFLQQTTDEQ